MDYEDLPDWANRLFWTMVTLVIAGMVWMAGILTYG